MMANEEQEIQAFIDNIFDSLREKEGGTGETNIFNLNNIKLPNISSDISNLLPVIKKKLENDKGGENNCFPSHSELLKKHNVYPKNKLMDLEEKSPTVISNNGTNEINTYDFYATEQLAVLWVLFLLIVLGNSSVLLALAFNKNRKSRMNYFIMQLAIADLAVGLISVLTDIIWRITIAWHAGNLACKVIRYLQVLVTYGSTYVLVALSIDRYDAIKHPMKFSGGWRRAKLLVAFAWVLSAVFSLPILILYEEKVVQGQKQCWIELSEQWHWQLYMTIVAVVLFFIPAIIITACYTVIVSTIWRKGSTIIVIKRSYKGVPTDKVRLEHEHESRRASSRGLIPKAKVKTVKMTFVIVFVFIVCWSPYIVFDLLQVYGYVPVTQTNIAVATFIQSLAPLNSAANPLIYCLFSTRICRTLRRVPPCSWLGQAASDWCPGLVAASCLSNDQSSTLTSSLQSSRGSRLSSKHVTVL